MRLALSCSGPVEGPIILDMSSKASHTRQKRRAKREALSPEAAIVLGFSNNGHDSRPLYERTDDSSDQDNVSISSAISIATYNPDTVSDFLHHRVPRLALVNSINDSFMVEQCLVQRFVDMSTSSRLRTNPNRLGSWLFAIPSLLSEVEPPSVRYSIRAAALIHFAAATQDKTAEVEAMKWYLAGLQSHRLSIQRRTGTSNLPLSQHYNVCVPMMFLYFETLKQTNPDAWAHHITAATSCVQAQGPEYYRIGQRHAIFRSLRVFAVRIFVESDMVNAMRSVLTEYQLGFQSTIEKRTLQPRLTRMV